MLKVGDSDSVSKTLTEFSVMQFAELCGDYNPVHIDPKVAAKSRFGRQVCHGMLVASLISSVLGIKLPGEGTIYLEQNLKFLAPVYIGDTVTATVTVLEVNKKIVTLKTDVTNDTGTIVITGEAKVLYEGVSM